MSIQAQLCTELYDVEDLRSVCCVEQSIDGGYIIGATVHTENEGYSVLLLKTDPLGNELWRNQYNTEGYQKNGISAFVPTISNDGYLIMGTAIEDNGTAFIKRLYYAKISLSGETIWEKALIEKSSGSSLIATDDGHYILLGSIDLSNYPSYTINSAFFVKINQSGEVIWQNNTGITFPNDPFEYSTSGISINNTNHNNQYIIAGRVELSDVDFPSLIKIDGNGQVIWKSFYNIDEPGLCGTNSIRINHVIHKNNNEYLLSLIHIPLYCYDASSVTLLLNIDENGELQNMYKQSSYLNTDMVENTNGNIMGIGYKSYTFYTEPHESSLFTSPINLAGNYLSTNNHNAPEYTPTDIANVKEEGYITTGVFSNSNSDQKIFLKRIDKLGHTCQNVIAGKVYADETANCELDVLERAVPNAFISLNNGVQEIVSSNFGEFSFVVDTGTYNISISTTPDIWETNCEENYTVTFDTLYQTIENINFALQPSIPCNLMNIDVGISRARACQEATLAIEYCNDGNTDAEDIRIELQISPLLENISSQTPFTQENGLYVFEPADLDWGKCRSIYLQYKTACDAQIDEQVCVEARIFPNDHCGEARPIDESITCLDVTNSYDPNDIQVEYEQPIEGEDCVFESGWLDYTIRFQNTGNDTAYRVMVMDTLPESVELESFHRGASSHNYELEFHQPNVLVWIFDDINLLDSLNNEPESHGFVSFRIRQKSDNLEGLVIGNQAHIYFDFNAPIATNTAMVQNCLKTTLPVELTFFEGKVREDGNFLQWNTASEANNDYFQLECSEDGKNFEVIGKIRGIGTTSFSQIYSFLDKSPPMGTTYYRLSQTDLDATIRYLGTISLHRQSPSKLYIQNIYPIPTSDKLFVEFGNPSMENLELELVNTLGQVVLRQSIEGNTNKAEVDCSGLKKGLYLLKLGEVWEKVVVR